VKVLDEAGDECEIGTLAADGQTLIGKGGTGIGYVTVDGNWCERADLRPVGVDGDTLDPLTSSFKAAIDLVEKITVEEFLDFDVRSVYSLPDLCDGTLAAEIRGGPIFRFPFSYRGGIEPEPAFLMAKSSC
jgi:hypothetical protein